MLDMEFKYTRHAIVDSMPDDKIEKREVEETIRKAEFRARIAANKFRFRYKDLEVICLKRPGFWLVITCYRLNR